MRILLGLTVGVTMLAASPAFAQGAKPGQPMPGPYRVFVVTGEVPKPSAEGLLPTERQNYGDHGRVGKFHDFVTRYGLDPAVAVIATGEPPAADQPLGKLLQMLNAAVERNKAARLRAWGVFLDIKEDFLKDESQSALVKNVEALADALKIKHVPLGIDLAADQPNNDRAKRYGIAADATVTVILYSNHTVRGRWDFTSAKPLDDAAIMAIQEEIKKVIGAKK